MKAWTVDELKRLLSESPKVEFWMIYGEHIHRRERYFLLDSNSVAIDQDRDTQGYQVKVRVVVKKENPEKVGESSQQVFPYLPLRDQVEALISAAEQTENDRWTLPHWENEKETPTLLMSDPEIAEDLNLAMDKVTKRISDEIGKIQSSDFNSAEIFLSTHELNVQASNGLHFSESRTRAYVEAAFSNQVGNGSEKKSDEYMTTAWGVHLDEIHVEKLLSESAQYAKQSLGAERPVSGKYAVLLDGQVLCHLFNDLVSHLSGNNSYLGLPFRKPGEYLIPEAEWDLVSMSLDPQVPYGAASGRFSGDGVFLEPVELVKENLVRATATDKKFADYLGISPVGACGNVIVKGGAKTYEELLIAQPIVFEILQFSALFSDANSGTFSSEIRLARIHDRESGSVRYVKGGSLSGGLFSQFKRVVFCKDLVKKSDFTETSRAASPFGGVGYLGPSHALMMDVPIVY